MGIVGCYSMDLYCDICSDRGNFIPRHGFDAYNFTGTNRADVFRQARREGWLLNQRAKKKEGSILGSGKALCPKHSGKRPPSAGPGS